MTNHLILIPQKWDQLMQEDKPVPNVTVVEIYGCGDIHPRRNPIFPDTETVIMRRCDKNFVFYWLNDTIFPKLKTVYLLSHPCDPSMFWRLKNYKVYLTERHFNYKARWGENRDNVVEFTSAKEKEQFGDYDLVFRQLKNDFASAN